MQILFLGDSLTRGYDVPYGQGWVELLEKKLYPHTCYNAGVDGASLQAITLLWERYRTQSSFGAVWVMGGTNDILQGRTADDCLRKLKSLIEMIQTDTKKRIPIIVGLPLPIEGGLDEEEKVMDDYATKLEAYCREQDLPYVDFYGPLKEALRQGKGILAGDVHPNARGDAMMYEIARPVMEFVLAHNKRHLATT